MAQLQKLYFVLVVVFIYFVVICCGKAVPEKREIDNNKASEFGSEDISKRICKNSTPCGWAVYIPIRKTIDYFMKNSRCNCPDNLICGRTIDDLSISAYVYRCINATEAAANPDDPYAFRRKTT